MRFAPSIGPFASTATTHVRRRLAPRPPHTTHDRLCSLGQPGPRCWCFDVSHMHFLREQLSCVCKALCLLACVCDVVCNTLFCYADISHPRLHSSQTRCVLSSRPLWVGSGPPAYFGAAHADRVAVVLPRGLARGSLECQNAGWEA